MTNHDLQIVAHKGWEIHTSHQSHPQFPFLATCWQGKVMKFNTEGKTREEALARAVSKIEASH